MSPESEQLVRETWSRLTPVSDAMVAAFYTRLFEFSPDTRRLFAEVDMVEQRRKFAAMLDDIVNALDSPGLLVTEVAASGRRHAGYGVVPRDYEVLGGALLFAISQSLGPAFTADVEAAWREAYALVAAVMCRAAATAEDKLV